MGSTDVPSIAMATSIGKWWINQWLGYPIFRSSGWQGTLHLLIGADVVEEMLGETCRVATKGEGRLVISRSVEGGATHFTFGKSTYLWKR